MYLQFLFAIIQAIFIPSLNLSVYVQTTLTLITLEKRDRNNAILIETYKILKLIVVEQQRMRTFLYLQQKVNNSSDSLYKIRSVYFLKIVKFNYIPQMKKVFNTVEIYLFKIVYKPQKLFCERTDQGK